uniref:Uncharacterized protein LOC111107282 n=1 Tax=Crassostrea virginica TaxID=6565 RepID=A0A8B8B4V3_CRAVI|nr:uncharacterized protein LOC111107282 [Crassostrea virginica]XP_022298119.1 uncharacterized protein LOC111107282 [Crassostrea virginica]
MACLGGALLRIILLVLVNLCGTLFVEAVNYKSYEFGQDCIVYKTVSEDEQFYITYKGASVSFFCDYFSFQTEWSWSQDASSYKICVKPMFFEDPNCSVRLKYKASSGGNTLHTITCLSGNSNNSFCGDYTDDLYVYFEKRGSLSTSNVRFKFLVYVEKESGDEDNSAVGWAIFGGVVGVIILFTLVAAVVFWFVCRRKPTKGSVLTPNQASSTPGVSQPGFPQATYTAPQSSNPNASLYPVGNYGPQYATGQTQYQPQSYSTPYQPPPQQYPPFSEFPEKQASAPPPPSYDEVTH